MGTYMGSDRDEKDTASQPSLTLWESPAENDELPGIQSLWVPSFLLQRLYGLSRRGHSGPVVEVQVLGRSPGLGVIGPHIILLLV